MEEKQVLLVTTTGDFLLKFQREEVKLLQRMGYLVHYAANFHEPPYVQDRAAIEALGVKTHQIPIARSPFLFRDNLRAGIPATVVFLLLGLALDAGFLFFTMAAQAAGDIWPLVRVVYCVLLLLPLSYLAVTFPLLSRFTFTAGGLLSTALRVTLRHLPAALGAAVLLAGSVILTLRFLYWGVILLTPAVCALVSSLLLEPVFRRYTPKEDGGDGGYRPWYLR